MFVLFCLVWFCFVLFDASLIHKTTVVSWSPCSFASAQCAWSAWSEWRAWSDGAGVGKIQHEVVSKNGGLPHWWKPKKTLSIRYCKQSNEHAAAAVRATTVSFPDRRPALALLELRRIQSHWLAHVQVPLKDLKTIEPRSKPLCSC